MKESTKSEDQVISKRGTKNGGGRKGRESGESGCTMNLKEKKKKSNSLHFINAISLYLSLFVLHSSEETEVHKNIQQVAQ